MDGKSGNHISRLTNERKEGRRAGWGGVGLGCLMEEKGGPCTSVTGELVDVPMV